MVSPYGVLNQSGIIGDSVASTASFTRLDTTYTYTDNVSARQANVGDFITNGLSWTRSIRMGGGQLERDFAVRPDLVTSALPVLTSTAAVPSTVDVYVNNIKTYSQQVDPGPFAIANLPSITAGGTARVVVRDAAGHETQQSLDFYASPRLLRPGVVDYSLEAGAPRVAYGTAADTYVGQVAGSGTLRQGVYDWLTLEGHVEAGSGLANGSFGTVLKLGSFGVLETAVALSHHDADTGGQLFGNFETSVGKLRIQARAQHTLGSFDDLASVTAREAPTVSGFLFVPGATISVRPPRDLDSISVGSPLYFDDSSLSGSFIHVVGDNATTSNIASLTYSKPLPYQSSLIATAYRDFSNNGSSGVYLGVTVPLDGRTSAQAAISTGNSGLSESVAIQRSRGNELNSWGYQIVDTEGGVETSRLAALSVKTQPAILGVQVQQLGSSLRGMAQADGAIAIAGGGVYASNHISDSFAVVDAGAPGVTVTRQGAPVGTTDWTGKVLVPDLMAYQRNKIAIDPDDLPFTADLDTSTREVTPPYQGALGVKFKVELDPKNATVILKRPNGSFVPAGSEGQVEGGQSFLVGFDGEAYIKGLKDQNTVTVKLDGGTCSARFAFKPAKGTIPIIGPEVCQ